MTKQIINVGTSANDRKGDSLRAAFQKVNANFTELYTALGLATDLNLNLGAFEFNGSIMTTTDSTSITIDQATRITSDLTLDGDLLPSTVNRGNLGSSTRPWNSLYVSNNTIYLNNVPIALDEVNNLTVNGTAVNAVGSADWSAITSKPSILSGDNVIGFTTANTITEEIPGGTVSQTTSYQNQIIIDTTDAIRIANVLSQTVNDGVTTATDSTGSTIDVDGTGVYIKKYAEPDGPNNSSYFQVSTTNSGTIIEGVNEDLVGNTYGRVTVAQGVVAINAAVGGIDKEWSFDFDGNLTVPEATSITGTNDLYIKSLVNGNSSGLYLNGNSLVGSAILYANGVATIRADNNGTTKDWSFGKNATLTTPLLLPKTFTAVLDSMHYSGEGSLTLEDIPWQYEVAFQVATNGTVETMMDQIFPNPSNPGYASGCVFTFVEADHGIPGYTFTITLNDVILPGGAGWTANVAVSQPPTYPSTVASSGAIKLTSSDKSFVFGTDGNLHLPGSIIFPYGTARIYGNTDIVGLLANPSIGAGLEIAAGSTVNLFNEGNVVISANVNQVSGQKDWIFRSDGSISLPGNTTRIIAPASVNVLGATPTVVYSVANWMTSIKLVIAVEGQLDGDISNTDHTQTCEATIAATYNTNDEPNMSVYGNVYTSPSPLATFTVARNTVAGTIEVTAVNSQTTNALNIRVQALQFVSRYD